jgi:DNA-binding transcriptional MerR regulator
MRWFKIRNKNYWRVNGDREYTILEVSQLTGITVRTLRNYLKVYQELLEPRRGYYNSLIFSEVHVKVFVMIKTLIKDGFKASEVLKKVQAELVCSEEESQTEAPSQDQNPKCIEPPVLPPESSANEALIRVQPQLLNQLNNYLLAQEKRNITLERRLGHIENLLTDLGREKPSLIERTFSRLMDSGHAFWSALTRAEA